MRIDTLGFLSPQGTPPEADPQLGKHLDVMHVTAVPPMLKRGEDILQGTERFPSLERTRMMLEGQPNIKIIEKADDFQGLEDSHTTGIILGLQETPFDVDSDMLHEFYSHGVRVITPAYQDADHPLGSGYTSPVNPLTDKGRQFLLDCADVGLIIDLSHLGHQTARDLLDFRETEGLNLPVLASHGGVFELYDGDMSHINNLRNLPWDVLERIADAQGIVGIYALTFGLSETDDSLTPFITQTVQAAKRLGPHAVAIGSDAIYKKRGIREWKATTEWLITQLAKAGELKPRFPDTPRELNAVGKIALIKQALQAEGLHPSEIEGIAGNNAAEFFTLSLKN